MGLSRASLVVVAAVTLFAARSASAMCGTPSTTFSPPTGTVLPATGTVYLFVTKMRYETPPPLRFEVDGARFTARRVASTPVYDVVRVDLVASGREVVIRWKSQKEYDATEVRYPIGVPEPGSARVTAVTELHDAWSCSHTDSINIEVLGNTIAYRLDWSDGESDVLPALMERRPERLLPGHDDWMIQWIEIGYASCLGNTVDPEPLATARDLQLTALFADGSERRFPPSRARLEGRHVRLPNELVEPDVTLTPLEPPPLETVVFRARNDGSSRWPLIGAIAGLAVAAAMAARLRRRMSDDIALS
jgi:hypothetical protein